MRNGKNMFTGAILLLLAAFLLMSQLGTSMAFSFWDIISTLIAAKLLVGVITTRNPKNLPYVAAFVYIVLRNQGFVEPVSTWAVLLAAVLVSSGIEHLFPKKGSPRIFRMNFSGDRSDYFSQSDEISTDNNPSIRTNFGGISRYLYADALETVHLSTNFGGMDIYFDQVQLSENGATVYLDCKFGGVDLYIPAHWNVINRVEATFGDADFPCKNGPAAEGAPTLIITGTVTFGGLDVHYV